MPYPRLRDAISRIRDAFWRPHADSGKSHPEFFVSKGCEYYSVARFAVYAQLIDVCGNLFHHAVEMFLKAGLAKCGKTDAELRKMGHSLRKLWRAYKREYPNAGLEPHNETINQLDKHEEIRYPNSGPGSIGMLVQWSGKPAKIQTSGSLKTPKQYAIIVNEIDDLVADLFKTSSWNPGPFMGMNQASLEAIKRENKHAKFLTTTITAATNVRQIKKPACTP
jgi:hypothetical protein